MKLNHKLYLYSFLANFGWLKRSYTAKIMLVAFLGTHVPLLTLLLSFVVSNSYSLEMAAQVMIIALLATLAGTVATLYALNHLLKPVILTSATLQNYLKTKALPELPTEYGDEAGTLMADTSQTLYKLDELIHYISNYDELTGLPNRALFCDRLCEIISKPENNQRLIAVFLLSIDDFTGISQFYSPEINTQLQERLTLENELHGALERNEMLVYYQPLIDLHSGQITAVEALIRWQHPTLGMISPAKFIPIAEANGAIVPIGEWVLRTACAQNRAWQLAGFTPIRISVNLSARQFEQPYLVEVINQIIEETGLKASDLELEVTESFLMGNIERSVKTLKQLRELGIWLALDDFGTGYSSLSYLKRFPVNILKIDQSFVQDVVSNPDSAAVTDAIIALAKSLRLSITAEGVETQEQLDYLKMQGCDEGQGYYFSRPVPADVIAPMLQKISQQIETIAA